MEKQQFCKIWCEWDIDSEYLLFTDKEAAKRWYESVMDDMGLDDTWEDLYNAKLIGVDWVEVWNG